MLSLGRGSVTGMAETQSFGPRSWFLMGIFDPKDWFWTPFSQLNNVTVREHNLRFTRFMLKCSRTVIFY
jgi:hypothetical protein